MADVLPTAVLLGKVLSGWSLKNFPSSPLGCPIPEAHFSFSHRTPPHSPPCQAVFKITQAALSSESILAQSTLKVLAIAYAATSSLCCLPHAPTLTLVSVLRCLRSQSPSPQTPEDTGQCSLSGFPGPSQLDLSKGTHSSSLRRGEPPSIVTTLLK